MVGSLAAWTEFSKVELKAAWKGYIMAGGSDSVMV